MGKYFGTDGVRGCANTVLTAEMAFNLGRAAATAVAKQKNINKINTDDKKPQILIGKDTRISGDMLEAALAAGICSMGVDVVLLGVIPTPGVAVLCRSFNALAGAVISASHNHFADNGIKFFLGDGNKLHDSLENEIEELLDNIDSLPRVEGAVVGRISTCPDALSTYETHLRNLQPDLTDLKGMKIVLDAANGAAHSIAVSLFRSLGADLTAIHCCPDGCNINEGCGSTHPEELIKAVLSSGADIGIALDGDADRIIVVDELGNLVDGDIILAVCAAQLQKEGLLENNKIVATIMSNMGLMLAMQTLGIEVLETKVGDRYVIEGLREAGAVLGGEQSGHIIFTHFNTTGDGLATALYILHTMREAGQPLSELAKIITKLPQELVNIRVRSKDGWQEDADIQAAIKKNSQLLAGRGRVVVRPSGTESLFRVMAEGDSPDELKNIVNEIASVISGKLC